MMVDLKYFDFQQLKLTFVYMRLNLAAAVGFKFDRKKIGKCALEQLIATFMDKEST